MVRESKREFSLRPRILKIQQLQILQREVPKGLSLLMELNLRNL